MAITRKSIQPLNLHTYDVLIEDTGVRSDYFKISQFDGYFYGGRNAFLLAGASALKPNSRVLVEILNKDNKTVYSSPIVSFLEGDSRLIQVEVYSDTPIGPGKLVILGCAQTYIDGTDIPSEWKDKYNVRWITDIIISPLVKNKTPIRFLNTPSVNVIEKFYNVAATASFSESVSIPVDVKINSKNYNIYPNGYLININGPSSPKFDSSYLGGIITGSIIINIDDKIESASVRLPITKIYNSNLAESEGSLIYTDSKKLLLQGYISSSGSYLTSLNPFGNKFITSSINLVYSKLNVFETGSLASYASIRIVDLKTLSGEINKVRISYKPETDTGDYVLLADVPTAVSELISVDSASKVAETGKFKDIFIDDYWYSATMSLQKNQSEPTLPAYYFSSSVAVSSLQLTKNSNSLIDSITATPEIINNKFINNVSYFIGTKERNYVELFPRTEYTLAFSAFVSKTSGSINLIQDDYSLEIYLVPVSGSTTRVLDENTRGQLIGTINPSNEFQKQNFGVVELNFVPRIKEYGLYGLRFVVYGGFWSIANISLKAATEPFFSPDEITALIPITNYKNNILTFRLEYLDVNNNSAGISTLSTPVYFTGSALTVTSIASTASLALSVIGDPNRVLYNNSTNVTTTSANLTFDGSNLTVGGQLNATTKSFLINHPNKLGWKLHYGSLESPYHGIRLTGTGEIVNSFCEIYLPSYISDLVKHTDFNIQLTNIQHSKQLWVDVVDILNNKFIVKCKQDILFNKKYKFYWSFTAIRKDVPPLLVEIE